MSKCLTTTDVVRLPLLPHDRHPSFTMQIFETPKSLVDLVLGIEGRMSATDRVTLPLNVNACILWLSIEELEGYQSSVDRATAEASV